MIVSITGTPGTGKSTVGDILRSRGHNVIELGEFIKENELYGELDEERGSYNVDPEELDVVLKQKLPGGTVLLVGHLSHLVSVDVNRRSGAGRPCLLAGSAKGAIHEPR